MASAAPSTPPAAEPRAKYLPRRPATATRSPRTFQEEMAAAEVLDRLMRQFNVSNVELGESMGVPEVIVRRLRSGELAMKVAHVLLMERRFACRLFDALHAARSHSE